MTQKNPKIMQKKIQQKLAYATPLISMSCGMPIFAEFFFRFFKIFSKIFRNFQKVFQIFSEIFRFFPTFSKKNSAKTGIRHALNFYVVRYANFC
jgi:hypothetical protein